MDDIAAALPVDVTELDDDTLRNLCNAAAHELDAREKAKRDQLITGFLAQAEKLGLSRQELAARIAPKNGAGKKPKPRYRNPKNPKQTWTGRGKQPTWLKSLLDSGAKLEEFEIGNT